MKLLNQAATKTTQKVAIYTHYALNSHFPRRSDFAEEFQFRYLMEFRYLKTVATFLQRESAELHLETDMQAKKMH